MSRISWRVAAGVSVAASLTLAACRDEEPARATATTQPSVATPGPSTPPATTNTAPTTTAPTITAPPTTTLVVPSTGIPPPQCAHLTQGVNEITLEAGGAAHPVRLFVPSGFAGSPLPVVIDWHGLGSNGTQQAMYSDYETVAEAEGFLAVHPTGVPVDDGGPNSWQLRAGDATAGGRDDLAFAQGLVDELVQHWCADESRIYSTGMSNGGFFTARLICEMSDRIAAAVSVAGTYHPESCEPTRSVPYLAYHGTADAVVPWDGSGDSTLLSPDAPEEWTLFFTQVIPDEFAEFAADAGCELDPALAPIGADVVRHEYAGCADGISMALFEVVEGGHTWPGSPMADAVRNALGHTTDAVDATRDGWAFMSQFQLPN